MFRGGTSCCYGTQEKGSCSATLPQQRWRGLGLGRDAGGATECARRLPDSAGSGSMSSDITSYQLTKGQKTELLLCPLTECHHSNAIRWWYGRTFLEFFFFFLLQWRCETWTCFDLLIVCKAMPLLLTIPSIGSLEKIWQNVLWAFLRGRGLLYTLSCWLDKTCDSDCET